MKMNEQLGMYVALLDHEFEVNIMSSKCYTLGKWLIKQNHGWKIKVSLDIIEDLYGIMK